MSGRYRSLSKRLSIRILIVVLAVMTLIEWAMSRETVQAMSDIMRSHYDVLLEVTNTLIEDDLKHMNDTLDSASAKEARKRSIEWLRQWLKKQDAKTNKMSYEENGGKYSSDKDLRIYSVVIDHKGRYISHPDSLCMVKENFFTQVGKNKDTVAVRIINDMRIGGSGEALTVIDGRKVKVFYDPLKHTDWTMAIIVPQKLEDALIREKMILQVNSIAIALLLLYLICHFTIRHTTRPLKALAESAREVAKGRFNVPLPKISHHDEVRLLRDSFEEMQQSLGDFMEQLQKTTAEKASMENELDIARQIQMAMLPKAFPERDDLEIYAMLRPAKAVGGDLYDFFLRDDKLVFCIGDVTGKGVPAALLMTVTKNLFRAYSDKEDNPEVIVRQMNMMMSENNEADIFVTLFVGVLDLSSGYFRYCSAGHRPPMLIGTDIGELPFSPALPLCCLPDAPYQCHEYLIEPDMTLFLYTDGLDEACDTQKNMFEGDRVRDVTRQAIDAHLQSPKAFIELMARKLGVFVGDAEQSDDLTMMAIRLLSPHTLRMKASATDYQRMTDFVADTAERAHLDEYHSKRLRLAVEEAVGNIIDYSGASEIVLSDNIQKDHLTITIIDDGKPFDPTTVTIPDPSLKDSEDLRPGGLGILFINQMSKALQYHRIGDKNMLIIRS